MKTYVIVIHQTDNLPLFHRWKRNQLDMVLVLIYRHDCIRNLSDIPCILLHSLWNRIPEMVI